MGSELTFAVFGLSGVAAGFFAGLFGIGGGLIMVPALVYAFTTTGVGTQQAVAMALGTSMAAIVFSAAQTAYGHYRRGSTSIETIRRTAPWVVVGVVLGTAVAAETPAIPLLTFVACFQFFAAALMLTDVSKLAVLRLVARHDLALNVFSLAFGGIAALAGIGGGTLFTPYFQGRRDGDEACYRHVGSDRPAGEPGGCCGLRMGRPQRVAGPLDAGLHQFACAGSSGCGNPGDGACRCGSCALAALADAGGIIRVVSGLQRSAPIVFCIAVNPAIWGRHRRMFKHSRCFARPYRPSRPRERSRPPVQRRNRAQPELIVIIGAWQVPAPLAFV